MQHSNRWLVVVIPIIAGLQLSACHRESAPPAHVAPAHVEHIEGTELSRLTLTDMALQRLAIESATVSEMRVSRSDASLRKVVPYSAVIYDAQGKTWVYTRPQPETFVRHEVEVDYIDGDTAVLVDGPPVGTEVVTVGVSELFGAEFEIGH